MKRLILLLICGVFGLSCSDDLSNSDEHANENEKGILFNLNLLPPASTSYTRSGGTTRQTDPESLIREIQVLVFENGIYQYYASGISVDSKGATTVFQARLRKTDLPVKLLILANANSDVISREPSRGSDTTAVKAALIRTFTAAGTQSPFPMYGEYTLAAGIAGGQGHSIDGIQMVRTVARIDVQASETENFTLTSIQAFRAQNQIQLIPDESNTTVSRPSLPQGSSASVQTDPLTVEGYESASQLYLPESASPTGDPIHEATCIVIGGLYSEQTTPTYYRIDFNSKNEESAFGQILRNHRYVFNIQKVLAPGWENPGDAATNRSSSIQVEIKEWDDQTTDMSFDGEHHFGVSKRVVEVEKKAGSSDTIQINTDLTDYTLQWSDSTGNPAGSENNDLKNSFFQVEKTKDGGQLKVTSLSSNTTEAIRTAYFIITANRWRILITIRQGFETPPQKIINMLTFNQGLGYLGTNRILPVQAAQGRSDGLRGILDNLNNFGPEGTVTCGGYNLFMTNVSFNNLSSELFATADVIYVHYMPNSSFGATDSRRVHQWLENKTNRVLIVSFDASDVSVNLMTEIAGGIGNIIWLRVNTGGFPLVGKASDNYFTDGGPFTSSPYTPVSANFKFQNYDAYHGEISSTGAAGITPILSGPGGGIVLGIDYNRRIVYWGDTDLGNSSAGIGGNSTNHIVNTTGIISNDASKLIANLFARITEIVLSEDQ